MKRGNIFHLRKRVPRRYQSVEERKSIWVSLHTDSETVANTKAPIAWQHLVEAWEARLAGDTADADRRFEAAKELAAVRGFRYLPVVKVAGLPREELLARIEAAQGRDGERTAHNSDAGAGPVLGFGG